MDRELYVEIPESLVGEVEDTGIEALETFRTGGLGEAVNVTIQVMAVGANMATIALAGDAIHAFATKLCHAVLRRSSPTNPSVQLDLTVRGPAGQTSVKIEITRSNADEPTDDAIELVRSALAETFDAITR